MAATHNTIKKTTFFVYTLLVINTILVLTPTWSGSFIAFYIDIEDFEFFSVRLTRFINLFLVFLILYYNGIRQTSIANVLYVTFILMIASKVVNVTIEEITTPIEFLIIYTALFCSFSKIAYPNRFLEILSLVYIMWSILPVLYLPVAPISHRLMMFSTDIDAKELTSTFSGFARHRNVYGFYAGISVLLILFSKHKNFIKILVLLLLSTGLFLSASRGSLLATVCAVLYYYLKKEYIKQKLWGIVVLGIAICLLLFYGNMSDSRLVAGLGGRSDLNQIALVRFLDSPLFGYGKSTLLDINHHEGIDSPVHNFILQALLDYGFFATLSFLIVLFLLLKKSCNKSKAILLFLIVVGLVQPYFTLSAPSHFTLITYLFVICYNSNEFSKKQQIVICQNNTIT